VLALLPGRALITLAAVHRGETGDALAVEAAEPRFAIAGRLTLLAAAIEAPVAMLALLAEGAALRFATEHRRDAGGAASVVAHQTGGAVARGLALFARVGHTDLHRAVAAVRTARHAGATVAGRAARFGVRLGLAGRDGRRADEVGFARLDGGCRCGADQERENDK
jgi:hypothetical protein